MIDPALRDSLDHLDPMERLRLELELDRLLALYEPDSFDNTETVYDPAVALEPSIAWCRYVSDRFTAHVGTMIDRTIDRHGRIPGLFRPRS